MARPPRIQFEGACYHVFQRGNRRERIYWDEADYAQFEGFMIEAMNWSGVRLYDWSLMPNHFHFLLETPDGNLAEFMQRLLTRYAKYFNRKHRKVGHVFQGRYQAKVCDKESYFLELIRYVELNPYRLKKGSLAQLGQWRWSSYRYYMGLEEPPEGVKGPMAEVLGRFGANLELARENFVKFLVDGLKQGTWEDFYQIKDRRFLGDEEFIERVKNAVQEPVRQERRLLIRLSGVEELGEKAAECFHISLEELARAGKERRLSRIRQAYMEVGRSYYRFPVLELAKYLRRSERLLDYLQSSVREGLGKAIVAAEC
jgi:putative transposase